MVTEMPRVNVVHSLKIAKIGQKNRAFDDFRQAAARGLAYRPDILHDLLGLFADIF